jgi:hypothetical protein
VSGFVANTESRCGCEYAALGDSDRERWDAFTDNQRAEHPAKLLRDSVAGGPDPLCGIEDLAASHTH